MNGKRLWAMFVSFVLIIGAVISVPLLMGATSEHYNEKNGFVFNPPSQSRDAFSGKNIPVTNGNLSQTAGGDFIYSDNVSGWTLNSNKSTTLGGALDLNRFQEFKTKNVNHILWNTYMEHSPRSRNNNPNVFFLADNKNASSKANLTGETVELAANGYYMVSVDFYAIGGFGTFALVPYTDATVEEIAGEVTETPKSKFRDNFVPEIYLGAVEWGENKSEWRTAQFFVRTDIMASQKFNIRLSLGNDGPSRGAIYFQNPTVTRLSYGSYIDIKDDHYETAGKLNSLSMEINLGNDVPNLKTLVDENRRADGRSVTSEITGYDADGEPVRSPVYRGEDTAATGFNFVKNNDPVYPDLEMNGTLSRIGVSTTSVPALLNFKERDYLYPYDGGAPRNVNLLAAKNGIAGIKLETPFLVRRHQIYMIGFYALSNAQGATMRLRDHTLKQIEDNNRAYSPDPELSNKKTEDYYNSDFKPVAISTSPNENNGWCYNAFFIAGDIYDDVLTDIEFWVGSENALADGWVLLDGFNIERISTEYFNAQSKIPEMVLNLVKTEGTPAVTDAYFNNGRPKSIDAPYPLTPTNWKIDNAENNSKVKSGIVNTDPAHWSNYDYNGTIAAGNYGLVMQNPGAIRGLGINNNVLMLQNIGDTWQSIEFPAISLGGGETNIISFDIARQYNRKSGLVLNVVATVRGHEIAHLDLGVAPSASYSNDVITDWERVGISVKESSVTNRDVVITIEMGTPDKFCPAATVFIDNIDKTQTTDYTPNDKFKYIDISDARNFIKPVKDTTVTFDRDKDEIVITGNGNKETASAVNTVVETLSAGQFYEYKVRVSIDRGTAYPIPQYTNTLKIEDNQITGGLELDTTEREYGVNFVLDGFGESAGNGDGFHNLTYEKLYQMKTWDERDEYAELTFYICPDNEHELPLLIEFGNEFGGYNTTVHIKSITLTQIDEDKYAKAKNKKQEYDDAGDTARSSAIEFITSTWKETFPEGGGNGATAKKDFQWWIIVPSLILGAALIVAICGFFIRRIRFNVHMDKMHTTYASDDKTYKK
jgi:hypothetical protein